MALFRRRPRSHFEEPPPLDGLWAKITTSPASGSLHGWIEQKRLPGGLFADMLGGHSGTAGSRPAVEVNGAKANVGTIVWLQKGIGPEWLFDCACRYSSSSSSSTVPCSTCPDGIPANLTLSLCRLGPTGFPPGSVCTDPALSCPCLQGCWTVPLVYSAASKLWRGAWSNPCPSCGITWADKIYFGLSCAASCNAAWCNRTQGFVLFLKVNQPGAPPGSPLGGGAPPEFVYEDLCGAALLYWHTAICSRTHACHPLDVQFDLLPGGGGFETFITDSGKICCAAPALRICFNQVEVLE